MKTLYEKTVEYIEHQEDNGVGQFLDTVQFMLDNVQTPVGYTEIRRCVSAAWVFVFDDPLPEPIHTGENKDWKEELRNLKRSCKGDVDTDTLVADFIHDVFASSLFIYSHITELLTVLQKALRMGV